MLVLYGNIQGFKSLCLKQIFIIKICVFTGDVCNVGGMVFSLPFDVLLASC